VHFVGLFLSSLLKMHGPKNKIKNKTRFIVYYAASTGNFLPTFRDKLSVPSLMGPIGCPETSVRNYHYSLYDNLEECSSHVRSGGSLKSRAE